MRALLSLTALLAWGCAENAILELEVTVPTAAAAGYPDATQVILGFQSSTATDPSALSARPAEQRTIDLPTADAAIQPIAVEASGLELEQALFVSVRYCAVPCGEVPPLWIRYERAFYLGEYTEHRVALPVAGDDVLDVGTCEVRGCFPGTPTTTGFCYDGTERHFCLPGN